MAVPRPVGDGQYGFFLGKLPLLSVRETRGGLGGQQLVRVSFAYATPAPTHTQPDEAVGDTAHSLRRVPTRLSLVAALLTAGDHFATNPWEETREFDNRA